MESADKLEKNKLIVLADLLARTLTCSSKLAFNSSVTKCEQSERIEKFKIDMNLIKKQTPLTVEH